MCVCVCVCVCVLLTLRFFLLLDTAFAVWRHCFRTIEFTLFFFSAFSSGHRKLQHHPIHHLLSAAIRCCRNLPIRQLQRCSQRCPHAGKEHCGMQHDVGESEIPFFFREQKQFFFPLNKYQTCPRSKVTAHTESASATEVCNSFFFLFYSPHPS